jgi:UDP-glucuronate decarboxylase
MMNQDKIIGPVNIGNPDERTVGELAEAVIRMTGSSSRIAYRDLPKDDPEKRRPDITLAKKYLGWKPTVPFEEGIGKTVEYFRTIGR